MALTKNSVHAAPACEVRSIVTDASGWLRHWRQCNEHHIIEECLDASCWHTQLHVHFIHGDTTA